MRPDATEPIAGSRLSVTIEVSGASGVASAPFHVTFDPAVLRFESGEEGTFLAMSGSQTAFLIAPTSNGSEVVVGLSILGPDRGRDGGGVLCTLHFAVVGPGDARLAFTRAHLRDSGNRILPATFEAVSITAR
jgi:hypothetical protein